MINISEIVSGWRTNEDGWAVAPAGLNWIQEDSRLRAGVACMIDEGCKLGAYCVLGADCKLKADCILGNSCFIGESCTLDHYCFIGNNTSLGNNCALGECCMIGADSALLDNCTLLPDCNLGGGTRIGPNVSSAIDLGTSDGYRKCLAFDKSGAPYIGAGCRWFPFETALLHWENHYHDRRATVLQLQYAESLIALRSQNGGN